jgi:beta-lactamase class D
MLLLLALAFGHAHAATPNAAKPASDIAARFADYGHPGAWLIQREGDRMRVIHGGALADKQQPPASTFKVLLALVALETGALRSADEVVPWDGRKYPNFPEWQTDMALRQAMRTSSESYFRVLADRIGRERLAAWVAKVDYGNGRIGPRASRAWHDGVLTVTAKQQLAFIDRVRRGDLPFAPATLATVKAAMLTREANGRRVYGKTGTSSNDNGQTGVGWWIGWEEGNGAATSFVLELELKTLDSRDKRVVFGEQLLAEEHAAPAR